MGLFSAVIKHSSERYEIALQCYSQLQTLSFYMPWIRKLAREKR